MMQFSSQYLFLIFCVALCVWYGITTWLIWPLSTELLFDPTLSTTDALQRIIRLHIEVFREQTMLTQVATAVIAFLCGINVVLIIDIRRAAQIPFSTHAGMFSSIAMMIVGTGCAACGPLVFSSLLASIGMVGIASTTPVTSTVFIIGSILLIGLSVFSLYRLRVKTTCSLPL